ncbi:substrate-binding domain-containing protein [Streptomyces millisiae]|uniref:Substrate-binding domain-containing protein n=1 Tax=Streptomyces millisiae TaxID=3075542 RepID=A0ABU2LSM1_9ACTN|nr:substrate-binding domain-containing protein [Streptomyces sp. DSM 44918]MDT0320591.1 substrate-binding domain-containing protein [Streptomyces sp. DSM 44918]
MAELLVAQRHELLLRELEAAGGLKVSELVTRLGVSGATIRRDLADLEAEGRVTRVRGGAMLAMPTPAADVPAAPAPVPAAPTRALGLLVPSATYYYPRVVAGVRAAAAERGARIIIGLTDYARPDDLTQIEELRAAGAAGLLVTSAGGPLVPESTLERLRECGLPFVLLERQPQDRYGPYEFVASDHRQGAVAAVRHLAELGHERVALFTNGSPTAAQIREGYAAAVELLGLDPAAPVQDSGQPSPGAAEAAERHDRFVEACLAGGVRAALVHSDHDAIELMRRLRGRGLRTPDDLALIAYDDEIAALADVPLTAVAPAKHELGELAARLLLDRLDADEPPAVRQMTLQPRLIVRSSCGAVPTREP